MYKMSCTSLPVLGRNLARVHNGRLYRHGQSKMARSVQKCLKNENRYTLKSNKFMQILK